MENNSRGLHPAHLHVLQRGHLRQLYQQYEGKWQCDCCKNNYDAMKNSEQYAYHCNQCYYDLCQQCWLGYYHPFHHHRIKPAKTEILYPSTAGCSVVLWRLSPELSWSIWTKLLQLWTMWRYWFVWTMFQWRLGSSSTSSRWTSTEAGRPSCCLPWIPQLVL